MDDSDETQFEYFKRDERQAVGEEVVKSRRWARLTWRCFLLMLAASVVPLARLIAIEIEWEHRRELTLAPLATQANWRKYAPLAGIGVPAESRYWIVALAVFVGLALGFLAAYLAMGWRARCLRRPY